LRFTRKAARSGGLFLSRASAIDVLGKCGALPGADVFLTRQAIRAAEVLSRQWRVALFERAAVSAGIVHWTAQTRNQHASKTPPDAPVLIAEHRRLLSLNPASMRDLGLRWKETENTQAAGTPTGATRSAFKQIRRPAFL
jgi:hypothetical protein